MNKKVWFLVFDILITLGVIFMILNLINRNRIPDNYMFVFHGEEDTITFETYIYKVEGKGPNMGFDYIDVIVKDGYRKVTKKGTVTWTDEVFGVAYYNNAYSYVTYNGSDKKYTIDEFMPMFLMN